MVKNIKLKSFLTIALHSVIASSFQLILIVGHYKQPAVCPFDDPVKEIHLNIGLKAYFRFSAQPSVCGV